jgi:hypothetical protein
MSAGAVRVARHRAVAAMRDCLEAGPEGPALRAARRPA